MTRPRVKICGITRLDDAVRAVELGADALGFVFWQRSPRHVTADVAAVIVRSVPALVTCVGVFVNASPRDVEETVARVGLGAVQLHGDERAEDYRDAGARLIRAAPLATDDDVAAALELPPDVTVLVDAKDPERRGGTGRRADWARAARIARARPILLAGGLGPDNVADAIREVGPWGVDVASGVESSAGIKDPKRLEALFAAMRSLDETGKEST